MKTIEKDNLEHDNMTGENHGGKMPNTPVKYLTSSSIIGDRVYNHMDERLGEIKEIMLDVRKGKIEYVVIEYGGFLGVGGKLFAIPFEALEIDPARHAFVLRQDRDTLENAPGFDKSHWPETNEHMLAESSAYWGGFMGPNTGAVPY